MKTIIEKHKKTISFILDFINLVVLILLSMPFYGFKSPCGEYITNIGLPITVCFAGYNFYLLSSLLLISILNIYLKNYNFKIKIKLAMLLTSISVGFTVNSLTTFVGGY